MTSRLQFLGILPLLLLGFRSAGTTATQDKTPAQTTDDLVTMMVTVGHSKGFIDGLKREAFTVTDEKAVRPIEVFENEDAPVSVGILIDHSQSVHPAITRISDGLKNVVQIGNQNNEYFVLSFNKTSTLVLDWSFGRDLLYRTIEVKEGKDETLLYDSCIAAVEKFRTAMYSRRALILIGDGQDSVSKHTFKEVRNLLRNSDITVYTVGIRGNVDAASALGMEGQAILDEFSFITGGMSFYPQNKKDLNIVFSQIAAELHHRYRIGFRRDPNDPPGKWRHLKIKVKVPEASKVDKLAVRTREGYYSR